MIIGVILILLGAGSCFYGNYLNNQLEKQLMSIWEHGQLNPGNIYFIIGIGLAVLGLVIIIWRLLSRKRR